MTLEQKINLLKSINHAFGRGIMEDYTRDEQNAYLEIAEQLDGYVKGVSNENLVLNKINTLEADNREIEQVLAREENSIAYFEAHYAENPAWASHYQTLGEIQTRITEKEHAESRALEKEQSAKRVLDEVYAQPFEPNPQDPEYSLIRQEQEAINSFDEKMAEDKKWLTDLEKKEAQSAHGAEEAYKTLIQSVNKKELDEIIERYKKLYDLVENAMEDVEQYESDLDSFIEEQAPEVKSYLNLEKKKDDDMYKRIHYEKGIESNIKENEKYKKKLSERLLRAKGRVYPEKKAYDEAVQNHQKEVEELANAKQQLVDYRNRSSEMVKHALAEKKANNTRTLVNLEKFRAIDKALSANAIYRNNQMLSAASLVKEAYNNYYNAHNFFGRFFKFIKWTSAHKDYQDYLEIRQCYKNYMQDRITDQSLDDYIKNNIDAPAITPIPEANVQPEEQRKQIIVDLALDNKNRDAADHTLDNQPVKGKDAVENAYNFDKSPNGEKDSEIKNL